MISGGPGTGKTTTVVKIIALLIEQALKAGAAPPLIDLLAPTGKAAARLEESVRAAGSKLGLEDEVLSNIPLEGATLHRRLGYNPRGFGSFRHGKKDPLGADVVIIDEASMIDLGLMVKLVDAIPAHTRLILLGDRDQLASVEAGSVLDDICAGSEGLPADLAARICRLTGADPPAVKRTAPLCGSVAVLSLIHI